MQMEDRIHLRFTNRIEVHQVAVVRQKIIVGAASPFAVGTKRTDIEVEHVAGEYGTDRKRMVHVHRIISSLYIPPFCSSPHEQSHNDKATQGCHECSPSAARRRDRSWLKASIADSRCNDTGHAHNQEQSENAQRNAESSLHLQR